MKQEDSPGREPSRRLLRERPEHPFTRLALTARTRLHVRANATPPRQSAFVNDYVIDLSPPTALCYGAQQGQNPEEGCCALPQRTLDFTI